MYDTSYTEWYLANDGLWYVLYDGKYDYFCSWCMWMIPGGYDVDD